jgi:hypothetical protein
MSVSPDERARRLRILGHTVLIAGAFAALVIYRTAAPPPESPLGDPEDSKQYLREMQMYGGEANVLAYEIRQGFDSLWHGRRLALTVAVLALLLAAGCRLAAGLLPHFEDSDPADPPGTGPG